MEPISVIDDVEFWLPPEFPTDEYLVMKKENNSGGIDISNKCMFPYEPRHGFGAFGSTVMRNNTMKEDGEDIFISGLTRKMVQSSLEHDISGGFCGHHAFPVCDNNKALRLNRSPLCVTGTGCSCRSQRSNQNSQPRVSSQATWDLYCAAMEEVARMSINNKPYHSSRGLIGTPTAVAASVKNYASTATGYYNDHQSLSYQKRQAIQFQQLKQQQLMKHLNRGLKLNSNKNIGPIDLSSSVAWSNQLPRRADFIGDYTGKRGSTGTGVFLPRNVNRTYSRGDTREKPSNADVSRRQRNNNGGISSQTHVGMKAEQSKNETRLPSHWTY